LCPPEGQLDQALRFRARDEYVRRDDKVQAKELFVAGKIGNWLSFCSAGYECLVGAQLGGGKGTFRMGIKPGPVLAQDMGQQYFGVQAGGITVSNGKSFSGVFQDWDYCIA
jgi:hypothetical protein